MHCPILTYNCIMMLFDLLGLIFEIFSKQNSLIYWELLHYRHRNQIHIGLQPFNNHFSTIWVLALAGRNIKLLVTEIVWLNHRLQSCRLVVVYCIKLRSRFQSYRRVEDCHNNCACFPVHLWCMISLLYQAS